MPTTQVPQDYIDVLEGKKQMDWDTADNIMDNVGPAFKDSFVPSSSDDYHVDPSNLTQDQKNELNIYAAQIINGIRQQFGTTPVKTNEAIIDLADQVAKNYNSDNFNSQKMEDNGIGAGHDANALGNQNLNDNPYGITWTRGSQDKEFFECIGNASNTFDYNNCTMNDLKHQILLGIVGDFYNDTDPNLNHAKAIAGLSGGTYVGTSIDKYGNVHFEFSDDNVEQSVKDAMNKTNVSIPSDSDLQNQKSELENQLSQQKQQVEQDKQTVQDLQNQVNADKEQIKNDTPTALQQKLEQDQKKLADDQAKLSQLQNTLNNDQTKLSQDQAKLKDLQEALSDPQAYLQKAQDKVNSTKTTLDNANKDLSDKQATLDQATKTYNDSVDKLNQLKQQLANDQAKLKQLQQTGNDYANADKALQEAQDAYNNAVKDLNDAQSQMNADSDTLAKAQQAYIDAQNKLNELETILKNDEKTITTVDVQWIKHPHTTAEMGNEVVLGSSKQNTSTAVTMPAVNSESSSVDEANTVHADTVSAVKEAQAEEATVKEADVIHFTTPAPTSIAKQEAKENTLPQMGDNNSKATLWGEISLAMAGILGMLGLAKRKRHE